METQGRPYTATIPGSAAMVLTHRHVEPRVDVVIAAFVLFCKGAPAPGRGRTLTLAAVLAALGLLYALT